MLRDLLILLIGWVLGIISHLIINAYQERKKRKQIKKSIIEELDEFILYLTRNISIMKKRFNTYTKDHIRELIKYLELIKHDNPKVIEDINKYKNELDLSDSDLLSHVEETRMTQGLGLKKYKLFYLEQKTNELSLFKEDFQRHARKILLFLNAFNIEIENAWFYYKESFRAGVTITDENYHIAGLEREKSYKKIHDGAIQIIEEIKIINNL